MYALSRMRFRACLIGIYEPPNIQTQVEILGREPLCLDGETEPVGVDLEEAERLVGVVRVGGLGDFGPVDQSAVGRVVGFGT